MSAHINKHSVQQRFDRAADDYDALAHIQREAADLLAEFLPPRSGACAPTLDAGCGTGLAGSRHLHDPVIALDLAPAMARHARAHTPQSLCADIEALPLAGSSIGLYWSSLAWQWCSLPRALDEAQRVLKPQGLLLIATLGPATLHELRDAFSGLDNARHVIDFTAPEHLIEAAQHAGFTDIETRTRLLQAWHPDTATLVRRLKHLGASEVGPARRRALMSRTLWQTVQTRYEKHRGPQGLPVSYEVILFKARRAP